MSTDAQGVSIELGEREGVKWVGVRTFGPHELRLCLLKRESQKARKPEEVSAALRVTDDRRHTSWTGALLPLAVHTVLGPESRVQSPDSKQEDGLIFRQRTWGNV